MSSGALGRRNTLDKWGFLFCECKWGVIYCKLLSESEYTLGKYFALGTLSLVWRSSCAAARLWDVRWFRAVVMCLFLRFCGNAWWCPEAVGTCLSCCTFKRARATLLELILREERERHAASTGTKRGLAARGTSIMASSHRLGPKFWHQTKSQTRTTSTTVGRPSSPICCTTLWRRTLAFDCWARFFPEYEWEIICRILPELSDWLVRGCFPVSLQDHDKFEFTRTGERVRTFAQIAFLRYISCMVC